MTDNPRRWRLFQFSLRTLLTLTLAFACFFGGWTVREWAYEREMERARQAAERERAKSFDPVMSIRVQLPTMGVGVEAPSPRYDLINDLPDNR